MDMKIPAAETQASTGTTTTDTAKRRGWRIAAVSFWILGFLLLVVSCVIVHSHPKPYAIDLTTTQTVQGLHVMPWINYVLVFPSLLNNPYPAGIALAVWLVFMVLMGFALQARGKSPIKWFNAAFFLIASTLISAGFNYVIDEIVARPRPDPREFHIQVHTGIIPIPTYPSGHTEHDVVFYGFLLYLSFSETIRKWRYRWLLIPLQIYAAFDILSIGYSRVLQGDHWLTDVLSGYLEGALYLCLFIYLYRLASGKLVEWQAKREAEKSAQTELL